MLICGDSLEWLEQHGGYHTIFADPPDNIGLEYGEYQDKMSQQQYINWLIRLLRLMAEKSTVCWLSFNHVWMPWVLMHGNNLCINLSKEWKIIIWRFTFGQYRTKDFGNGFRPILRIANRGWRPDTSQIRIESARQRLGDRRAADGGRLPDDVWDFARIVGNAKERRPWHPTQHPEGLMERIVLCSGEGTILDMFGGTGTTLRVCKRLGRECDTAELDPKYAALIASENNEKIHEQSIC